MMRFRISHKIAAIGLIGFGGLALVGGIYFAGDTAQEAYRVVAADARAMSDQVDRLDRDLLESRRAEKDFLLRNDEKYAKRHAELAKSVTTGLDALAGKARAAALADLEQERRGDPRRLCDLSAALRRRRRRQAQARPERGVRARRDAAQIGACDRDRAEGVRRAAPRRHHADDAAAREGLHAAPQRQIRRRHEEARRRVHRRARQAAAIPPAAKDDITQKLANYQRDFFDWMAAALVLVARTEGNVGQLRQDRADDRRGADGGREGARRQRGRRCGFARRAPSCRCRSRSCSISLGVALLAWMIGRAVSRPLSAMTGAMGKLAEGDFDVVLPGLGRKDEIGDMARRGRDASSSRRSRRREREAQEREAAAQRRARPRASRRCTGWPTASRRPSAASSKRFRPPRRSSRPPRAA